MDRYVRRLHRPAKDNVVELGLTQTHECIQWGDDESDNKNDDDDDALSQCSHGSSSPSLEEGAEGGITPTCTNRSSKTHPSNNSSATNKESDATLKRRESKRVKKNVQQEVDGVFDLLLVEEQKSKTPTDALITQCGVRSCLLSKLGGYSGTGGIAGYKHRRNRREAEQRIKQNIQKRFSGKGDVATASFLRSSKSSSNENLSVRKRRRPVGAALRQLVTDSGVNGSVSHAPQGDSRDEQDKDSLEYLLEEIQEEPIITIPSEHFSSPCREVSVSTAMAESNRTGELKRQTITRNTSMGDGVDERGVTHYQSSATMTKMGASAILLEKESFTDTLMLCGSNDDQQHRTNVAVASPDAFVNDKLPSEALGAVESKMTVSIESMNEPQIPTEESLTRNNCVIVCTSAVMGPTHTPQTANSLPLATEGKQTNELNEDDLFGDVQFSEDDFAAIDKAVDAQLAHNSSHSISSSATSLAVPVFLLKPESSVVFSSFINSKKPVAQSRLSRATTVSISNRSSDIISNGLGFMGLNDTICTHEHRHNDVTQHCSAAALPQCPRQNATTNEASDDDEFGNFPFTDFDELDKLIAQRSSTPTQISTCCSRQPPNVTDPVRNSTVVRDESDLGGPEFISFTRYKIRSIIMDMSTYTKTLAVAVWTHAISSVDEGNTSDFFEPGSDSESQPLNDKNVDGYIHLRGEWFHTQCEGDDTIHVCSLSGRYRTDVSALPLILHTTAPNGSDMQDDLVLIVHPNMLITPTIISESVGCTRRAVLKSRLGSSGLTSKAALFGTMRHELVEMCMFEQNFTANFALRKVSNIVRKHAESLVGCTIYNMSDAKSEVLRVLPQIQRFTSEYTIFGSDMQLSNATVNRANNVCNQWGSKLEGHDVQRNIYFSAQRVHGTEECIVSPELGLKGNADVTVEVITRDCPQTQSGYNNVSNEFETSLSKVPLYSLMRIELKTGHNQTTQNAHMAQLSLYTLMLRNRHGSAVLRNDPPCAKPPVLEAGLACRNGASKGGMLLYLNHESFRAIHVSPILQEIKSLIGQRNNVATELKRSNKPRAVVIRYEDEGEIEHMSGEAKERKKIIQIFPPTPTVLPDVLDSSHACERCYTNRECMMHAAANELEMAATFGVKKTHGSLLHHFTGHLNALELQYFRIWDRLIDLEAEACKHELAKSWLVKAEKREKMTGKCIANLLLDKSSIRHSMLKRAASLDHSAQEEQENILMRFNRDEKSKLTMHLNNLRLEPGSRVVLSSDSTIFHSQSVHSNTSSRTDQADNMELKPVSQKKFGHQMHILRGVLEKVEERSVFVRVGVKEAKQVVNLLDSYTLILHDNTLSMANCDISKPDRQIQFRLDKDEGSVGIGTLRQNLISFLTSGVPSYKPPSSKSAEIEIISNPAELAHQHRMRWLRKVIIHPDAPPRFQNHLIQSMFSAPPEQVLPEIPGCDFKSLEIEYSQLNFDQKNAVAKVIAAADYTLIQGLPGTGKTSTISFVTRLLAARGKRVLVTSYTHAAVDNLLMKLMESGVRNSRYSSPLIRIGHAQSSHSDLHTILSSRVASEMERLEGMNVPVTSQDGNNVDYYDKPSAQFLHKVVSEARILGLTALTIPRTPLLAGQHFDVVIVDEAGQISQPAILGALMAADSFVLVGDHMQLPPLVQSDAAEEAGYSVSMLKKLADSYPEAVSQLTMQYRMHEDICSMCNNVVYKGTLKCADNVVRFSKLTLTGYPDALLNSSNHSNQFKGYEQLSCQKEWLVKVLSPNRPVVFVDTDQLGISGKSFFEGLEITHGRSDAGNIVNKVEESLTRTAVQGFLACGLSLNSIGVICPYRSQLRLIDEDPFCERAKASGLEISTIDRYQGRDKEAIVLSLVRSNAKRKSGRLLNDFRRLNVAFSRAKKKLIIFGSYLTLTGGSDVLRPILEGMKEKGWVETLTDDATHIYDF